MCSTCKVHKSFDVSSAPVNVHDSCLCLWAYALRVCFGLRLCKRLWTSDDTLGMCSIMGMRSKTVRSNSLRSKTIWCYTNLGLDSVTQYVQVFRCLMCTSQCLDSVTQYVF